MKTSIYTLFDRVAEECGPVWTAKSDAVAIRNAKLSLKEVRQDEYRLYKIGEFDNEKILIFAEKMAVEVLIPETAKKE